MADNVLTVKLDQETVLPLFEQLSKSAYTIAVAHGFKGTELEWLDSLKGPQGPQGPSGPQGSEGPQGDRGPKGEPGNAEKTAELLKRNNVYLPDVSVDTVLSKIVELLGDQLKVSYKALEYTQPTAGQTHIDLTGEPHFFVSVNGGQNQELQSDNIRVNIPAYGEDDIIVDYFDLSGVKVGGVTVKGIPITDMVEEGYPDN